MTRTAFPARLQSTSPALPGAPEPSAATGASAAESGQPSAEASGASRKRPLPSQESSNAKRLRTSLASTRSARFFSGYKFAPGIVLPPELRSSCTRDRRGSTMLASVLANMVGGPELDARLASGLGLRNDLKYRFAEMKNGDERVTALLGYAEDRRSVEVAHRVEFDPNAMHFSPTDATPHGRALASNMGLTAGQTGSAMAVRINGKTQLMLVAREAHTGIIESVRDLAGEYADIAPLARGFMKRREIQKRAQATTPYPDFGTYLFATHNLRHDRMAPSGEEKTNSARRDRQRKEEWDMYRSSISIDLLAQRNAYIYSAKIRGELTRELKQRGMPDSLEPEKFGGIGHLYPSKMHTMRTNTAWMLGLAHRAVPVVMTTPLQETTLVRNAAPPGERTVEKHASAFIREIVAMLRGGFFTVSEDERGKKIFHPTGKARTATLDQMLTPPQMNREELDALLASYGLQVEPDQAIAREPRVGFNPVEWVGNLLQQDLEDPVQGFPRLDTCIRAGVAIPAELFQGIQEKLAAATPEKKGPLTAMLGKMLEGVGDDDDAMRALLHAASALSEADTVAGRQELTGLIHGKAISLQSDEQRNRVWARLSADVVAAEMQVSGDAGFPLVRHLCTLHESQAQHADARGSGPALPIERETFAPVVQARNLAPEAAERAIELLRFLLQTGEGDEPDVDALVNLARELPYFQSEELQAAAVQLANEAMERVSDPDARNEAHFYICRAMVSIEAGRPNPNSRLLSEIPMEAEFVAAAALQILYSPEEGTEKLSFLKGLIDALPGAREQEKALMLVAEMLPGARSGERLDQCLALIEERMRLGVSSESLHRAICKNLLRRPEEDHERTLDRLAAFGIVPDRELLVDVLRTIDDPYCEHGDQLCRLAREISNKLPADQKTEAMGDLLYCLQFGRPVPERLGLLETVLENAGSSGTGHDEPIALQIANTLAVVQDDLMKLPNVREVLRSVRQAIPEVFESDPDLAFAQLELAETDTQRKQILDRVLNDLPDCTRRSRERFEKMADLAASACDRFENPNLRSEALAGLATILERDEIFSQPWATDMMIWAMGSRVGKADALPLRALKAVIASIERLDEEGNQMHWHVMQDIGSQLGLPPRDRGVMDLVRDAREEIARREGAE